MKAALSIISGLVIIIFLISSCGSMSKEKRVPATWKDAAYSGKPLESVLVVGFTDNLDNRKLFEDTFLKYFSDNRIKTHTSLEALGEGKKIDSDSVKQAAEKLGVETVLVTHLLGVEDKEDLTGVKAYTDLAPYESLSDEYKELAGKYNSDFIRQYKSVKLVTNLYDVATEKLFWSYASEIQARTNVENFMATVCRDVIQNLKNDHLIQ